MNKKVTKFDFKDFCVFVYRIRAELCQKLDIDNDSDMHFIAVESVETILTVVRAFLRDAGVNHEKSFIFLDRCKKESERNQKGTHTNHRL